MSDGITWWVRQGEIGALEDGSTQNNRIIIEKSSPQIACKFLSPNISMRVALLIIVLVATVSANQLLLAQQVMTTLNQGLLAGEVKSNLGQVLLADDLKSSLNQILQAEDLESSFTITWTCGTCPASMFAVNCFTYNGGPSTISWPPLTPPTPPAQPQV